MTRFLSRALATAALAASLSVTASAQDGGGLLDRIFGTREPAAPEERQVVQAQVQATDLVVRLERLEAQIRQLTGAIEQLQFRNQQLEQEVRRLSGGAPPPAQAARPPVQGPPMQASPAPPPVAPPPAPPPGRRSDVFDPAQHPNAPGAPQTLGGLPAGAAAPLPPLGEEPVGVPGGRSAGEPLDLSTMASAGESAPPLANAPQPNAPLPPPPSRNPSGTGAVASVAPPSDTPKDHYDLGYGYVLRKDYALAEDTFQGFLKKYPNDRMAPDAQFWLGESLFQRQRYDAAAEQFLAVSTKHEGHAKAPDALLRLGQSLAALNQKEMACATLAEVGRKYPRASTSVKQGVDREQKRARC